MRPPPPLPPGAAGGPRGPPPLTPGGRGLPRPPAGAFGFGGAAQRVAADAGPQPSKKLKSFFWDKIPDARLTGEGFWCLGSRLYTVTFLVVEP